MLPVCLLLAAAGAVSSPDGSYDWANQHGVCNDQNHDRTKIRLQQ